MKSFRTVIRQLAFIIVPLLLTVPAAAQIPNTLLHSIPPTGPPQSGVQSGTAVAVGGGYVVVGAPFDDTDNVDAGAVQVFDVHSGALVQVLSNPGAGSNDQFGGAVAISGTRIAVGAANADAGATDAGMVYLFDLSSATPTVPVLTLTNPTPDTSDSYGVAVSMDGARVAVGAIRDDTAATDAGAVYVYDLNSLTPATPVLSLFNPGPPEGDYFGFAVGLSGPLLVVGAVRDDVGGFNDAGSAYVYDHTNGTLIATLNNPDPALQDQFARVVAISGNRVVVGVWQDNNLGTDAGTVFVYDMGGASPDVPTVLLTNPGIAPNGFDNFGTSVAVSGARIVVGTWRDDVGETDAGCAYVFDVSGGTPTVPVATLNNPTPGLGDNFGRAVGFDGIYAVVGAHLDDDKALDMGTAWIYGPVDGDNDGLRDLWEIAQFGTTAGHGPLDDHDHDGYNELLELGLGLTPTVSNPGGIPGMTQEGGYLTMTLTKQSGVAYEVQSAGSLLPALPDSFSAGTTTVLIDNATTLKVRDNFLISTAPGRFIHVKVTAAP